MSNSSNQDFHTPSKSRKRLWLMILSRGGIAVGAFLLLLIVGGVWRLRDFIQKELAPLAEKNLTTTLNRPVKLGQVKEFSLTGIRFDASAIPATPTDSDQATIEAVDVGFDPWQLVVNRNLKLDVTLINPEVYIQQDSQERWISTTIAPAGKEGLIKTDLDKLRFRNAKLVLVGQERAGNRRSRRNRGQRAGSRAQGGNINLPIIPSSQSPQSPPNPQSPIRKRRPPVPVVFSGLNGTAQLVENNKLIKFELAGKAESGGNIYLQGDLRAQATLEGKLKLKAEDLLAADITRLINLPLRLQAGRVNGDLQIQLIPEQDTLLYGSAVLQGVTLAIPSVPQLLSNSQGNLKFEGLAIKLDNVVSNYGKIPVMATGVIDGKKGFNLAGRVNAVSVSNALETLDIQSPLPVSGIFKADLQILGDISEPMLLGTVTNIKTAQIDKVDFKKISSKFELSTRDSLITFQDIQGETTLGGDVTGGGTIQLGTAPQLNINFTAKNVPGDAIAKLYDLKTNLSVGTVSATANLSGATNNVQTLVKWQAPQATYAATGETIINSDRTVSFRDVAVNINGNVVRGYGNYNSQSWQGVAEASGVKLAPFLNKEQLENISLGDAKFNGRLAISGTSAPFKLTNIRPEGAGVDIAGGRIAISRLQLQDQNFIAELIAQNVRLGQILKQSLPVLNNPLAGKFTIAGNTENFNLKTIGGVGEGSLKVGNGTITAKNIQVSNGRYKAQVQAQNVPLQKLATIPPELQGTLAGQLNVAGSVESFQLQTIQAAGQGQLNLAGGKVTAKNIQVANGNYQALVAGSGVQLNRLNKQLQGQFAGELQVAGILGSAKLADLRAAGSIQFSKGIGAINSPLNAAFAWNGQQLTIPQARTQNLNASGYILANGKEPGIPEITQLNLNVQAQNFDLQQLPFKFPNAVDVAGKLDFKGQITGKLNSPNVVGVLDLRNLKVQEFAFEPLLTGNINMVQGGGLSLDVAGKRDRLAAKLNANNQPSAFLLQWQQASATGQVKDDNWQVKVNNFPLKVLNFTLPGNNIVGNGALAGLLTGDLQVNQKTYAARGNIAIAQPQIGRIKGDAFSTQFSYDNGTASLTSSKFTTGQSSYILDATVKQTTKGPQLQAKININQGNIQDILTVAQIFELQDLQRGLAAPTYGTSADLQTNPQGLSNQPLFNQIQRLSEINALLAAQEQKRLDSNPIPDLTDFKGIFDGEIAINTATANGLAVDFNLRGENFTWGRETEPNRFYRAEKVIAEGSFEKGVLRLQPLRIVISQKRLIAFTGNIGGEEQSGQLRVRNFPIQVLNNFVKLPVGITGNLNATAALAGNVANPQARGELNVSEGTLNQKQVESATASFSYANGRLNFGSLVSAAGPEPVNISGSIPYKLPFASVEPDNNQINLDIKVKDEGLALLNLFTNQIAFENGEGEIDLSIRGTRQQPLVKGIAALNNASFVAQALPGKLTNVSGTAEFDFDKVLVQNLQGQFSKGKVEAAGQIPIFNSQDIKIDNPLTVNLEKLALTLKGLYQGGASGNLQITGSVLQPAIGGNIELFDGQVLLAESKTATTSNSVANSSNPTVNNQLKTQADGITKLNNLEIKLGKNIQIASPPLFNFQASGDLKVGGFLNDPIPEGAIRLTKGGVNLFTTQFNLARGYKHTATFRKSQPRDPDLDIKLFAKILDGIQSNDLSRQNSSGLAALETVRVEATVKGPASQLNDSLELKSSPSRSETEIVALLGGGFVDTQGRGDSTLGLINIAGSAVFNNFQGTFNQIGSVFGLSELRLFPTVISDRPEAGKSNSSLELALEAGVDISTKISVSSIKILTASDPFQWGLNYRINDEFRVRASTNLTDDSRAVIEFERRF
ncbi:translocation/assembly module TamB domain-containing protein [Anabaena cylindrica UHCC 0172]|uniref:translocation/assembly module TamB domain-containing protein n=1 Tax=Anabaena cylindrica TaxID=1165 RepID=UPI002B21D69E|nr:translocation/assembly module TamB domain-containing protein [Anabaena cylindrica]MEA5554257.1 translocation/assembly module TamB domain-containing protein [Anabaena cylindrica UHCC 0172]